VTGINKWKNKGWLGAGKEEKKRSRGEWLPTMRGLVLRPEAGNLILTDRAILGGEGPNGSDAVSADGTQANKSYWREKRVVF